MKMEKEHWTQVLNKEELEDAKERNDRNGVIALSWKDDKTFDKCMKLDELIQEGLRRFD